jgi:hypothetical protein
MDLNFISDPNLLPQPRHQMQIRTLTLTPYADGQRIRVDIEITPFLPADRPNIELTAHNDDGTEVASVSIVESMHNRISLTVHLRQTSSTDGYYLFKASLFYEAGVVQHMLEAGVKLPDDIPQEDMEKR